MGKAQRDKGKRGERATVNEIKKYLPWLGDAVRRGWQAREGSDDADVKGVPGFWVEVKTGKKPNIRAALQQANDARFQHWAVDRFGIASTPVAVIRDDRAPTIAVMFWEDLLDLMARAGVGKTEAK